MVEIDEGDGLDGFSHFEAYEKRRRKSKFDFG